MFTTVYDVDDGTKTNEDVFMFIPQTLTTVTIKYQWIQGSTVIDDYSAGKSVNVNSITMGANSAYTFCFSIEPNANEIKFTATVDTWTDEENKEFTID